VLHSANPLPSVFRALPSVYGKGPESSSARKNDAQIRWSE
jgi:hypothetical protein